MHVPAGMTREQVEEILVEAARAHGANKAFSYHEGEDIRQQAYLIGLEALPKFDPRKGKLPNFLARCMKNGLINFHRDEYERMDPPCRPCASNSPCEEGGCQRHREWVGRNRDKRALADLGGTADGCAGAAARDDVVAEADLSDALAAVDLHLPAHLRSDYARLRAGERLPRTRRQRVVEAVREALACR